jgi:YD repeat-containing protein
LSHGEQELTTSLSWFVLVYADDLSHSTSCGVDTTYSYNGFGDLSGIDYSDDTTDVSSITYDRRGRRTGSTDAAGTWRIALNARGDITGESVSGSGAILEGVSVAPGYDYSVRSWNTAANHFDNKPQHDITNNLLWV